VTARTSRPSEVGKGRVRVGKPRTAAIDRTNRGSPRIGLHDFAHLRGLAQHPLLKGNCERSPHRWISWTGRIGAANPGGHRELARDRLELTQPFVADEKEGLLLNDRSPECQPVLP